MAELIACQAKHIDVGKNICWAYTIVKCKK
nr:MAG TPA: hypothetical protein [Caudoviricetes sp.]